MGHNSKIFFSEEFKLKDRLDEEAIFDPIINVDSNYFMVLVKNCVDIELGS